MNFIIISIWKIATSYGANIDGTMGQNQKTSKTWSTVCNPVHSKRKPNTIPPRKCNNCVGALVVRLVVKYQRDIERGKMKKFKFELDKFVEHIPVEPKFSKYVTAARSNSNSTVGIPGPYLSGRIGKVVDSHAEGCKVARSNPGCG